MNRILWFFVYLVCSAVITLPLAERAYGDFAPDFTELGDHLPSGVYCEIKDVKLFAESDEDCVKAGGTVTHTITTTVKPVEKTGDNPNQEPEIQRGKDKKPVAP